MNLLCKKYIIFFKEISYDTAELKCCDAVLASPLIEQFMGTITKYFTIFKYFFIHICLKFRLPLSRETTFSLRRALFILMNFFLIYSFGSKLRSTKLGIIYNNELADFSEFWPSVYNLEKDRKIPGKRPMSKSSPTIFLDNKKNVKGVFGAAGGFFIPSCLTMVSLNTIVTNFFPA